MQGNFVMLYYIRLILKAMINHRNSKDDLKLGLLRIYIVMSDCERRHHIYDGLRVLSIKGRGYF